MGGAAEVKPIMINSACDGFHPSYDSSFLPPVPTRKMKVDGLLGRCKLGLSVSVKTGGMAGG